MYAIYKDNELLALAEELTFFVRDADGTNLSAEPEAAQGVVYNGVTYHIEGRPEISGAETVSLAQISTDGAAARPEDLKQNGVNFGRRGENLARVLRIDVSDMLEAYPGATIKALAQRPRENVAYVAESAVKDGVLYWPLTQVDTGIVGDGLAEVRALVGDVLAKSVLLRTHIDPSLTAPEDSATPPEPAKGWLQQAIEAAEKAQAAQTAAESSATAAAASATAAASSAQSAAKSAQDTLIIGTKVLQALGDVSSWEMVQQLVQQGLGPVAFPVGTRFKTHHTEYGDIIWDVAAHNHHKKPGDPDAPTMTLLMHHCIYGRQIDANELLWANTGDSALAAGAYNFTLYKGSNGGKTYEDGTYQFTTTKPIPAGGGWTHNKVGIFYANTADYKPENITSGAVTTYDAAGTVLESGLAVTAGSDGTALGTASNAKTDCVNTIGTFNSIMRRAYGSNNWAESAARQWLNSSAAANGWWQRQTIFDMVPSYADKAGFLAGLDPDFVDALGAVDITTARNTIYEMGDTLGGSYTTRDKLFLPSMTEIGFGSNDSAAEGSVLPLYDGATQVDRIKYDQAAQTTARYWWLRSPIPWEADKVRIVSPSGELNSFSATLGCGQEAECVIY